MSNTNANEFPPDNGENQQIILQLLKYGADPKKPHPLEHHFYCRSQESFKSLIKKGEHLGYRPANFGETVSEGIKYWHGDLVKPTELNIDLINKETLLMLTLAHEFNAVYDGWGTPIIK